MRSIRHTAFEHSKAVGEKETGAGAPPAGDSNRSKTEKPVGPGKAKDTFESVPVNDGIAGGKIIPELKGPRSSDAVTSTAAKPGGQTPAERAQHNKDLGATTGKEANPGDFAREAKLRSMLDPRAGMPAEKPGPGQSNPLDGSGKLPTLGDFKNHATRGSEASDEPAPSEAPKPLGPDTEDAAKWKEISQKLDAEKAKESPKETTQPPVKDTPASTAPPKSDGGITFGKVWAYTHLLIGGPDHVPGSGGLQPTAPAGTRGTPDPQKDGGDGHGPESLKEGPHFPSIGEARENQHRQVSLPGDAGSKPGRMHAGMEDALKEGMRKRADGRIDPGDSDGTTEGHHVDQPGPGTGGGIEQVDGKKKGDPKGPGGEE